jgi:two-component system, OmpR family, response regulator BaeR
MAKRNILIVEDDSKIAEILSDYLEKADFNVSIIKRGDTVISFVKFNPPDVILLDLMLPGKDGMTICREIRAFSNVPILIITAKVEEIDRLLGLELGADDYICKPFSPREVVARVKAVLRRIPGEQVETELTAGPITINQEKHSVTIGHENLHLTPIEFELLKLMVSRPHNLFTRDDFVSHIHGYDLENTRVIDSHIRNIRKKISQIMPDGNLIQTVYGMGYSLSLPKNPNLLNSGEKYI